MENRKGTGKVNLHKAWLNKGVALDNLGRPEKAINAYDKALEIKPDYHEAWYNKGVTLAATLYRPKEAINAFDNAIKIKPDDYKAWHNKGVALKALGRYEEAKKALDKEMEIKRKCKK